MHRKRGLVLGLILLLLVPLFRVQPTRARPASYNVAVQINGRAHRLHATPEINRDRAFLGLRDLGDLLEAETSWYTLDEQETWIAAIDAQKVAVAEPQEYEQTVRYMEPFTYAVADGDRRQGAGRQGAAGAPHLAYGGRHPGRDHPRWRTALPESGKGARSGGFS